MLLCLKCYVDKEDNFDMMNELKTFHKKETKGMLSSLSTLEDKLYALQAQIYDL